MARNELRDCFRSAIKGDSIGKKHKGLLIKKPDSKLAGKYLDKAKKNIELCEIYKNNRFDYMIPEAWYYTLYYCALAILSKFGVESRNQRCTASFLRYVKDNGLIDYDEEFINRIMVYTDKEEMSDVDERETARYGPYIESEEVSRQYNHRIEICKKAISQCEEIVFSNKEFKIPKELSL